MKTLEAASARNSVNRENLTALAYVGRGSMAVVPHRLERFFFEKIRKCERLNPESKTASVTDFVAKLVDKDRKGSLIGLGAGVCPTLLKKSKHLLIQNKDLRDINIELAGCLQQSKIPENLLRLVAGCRLQMLVIYVSGV
ncbi:hypothetical protein GIB67_000328 [Kingdonia uniflora]|uniref:Uncharacterized protein n=1 Tax=Kingdonia uniflora TaxID=39325 RepID=A0A7J7LCM8_9MAGN|nr:hypothetical protein GIB67_000328 [Kingdonia uniflora]